MVQQAADIVADQVDSKRPGGVDIAEDGHEVGHVGIGHTLVGPAFREVDLLAVDRDAHAADGQDP